MHSLPGPRVMTPKFVMRLTDYRAALDYSAL
jgi:hypothetical protein